jgi:hypothetical protein
LLGSPSRLTALEWRFNADFGRFVEWGTPVAFRVVEFGSGGVTPDPGGWLPKTV